MHSKVHHPGFVRIPEVFGRLGKGTEHGRSGLLLPNGSALARWCERDPQVLQVPVPQRLGIMSSEEQPSDAGYFFHFRSSDSCLAAAFPGGAGLAGGAGFCAAMANLFWGRMKLAESIRQDLKYLAPL